MDDVKVDNERELTSTMGNVLSMSNKDEKNDTSDATPTSSTDANTTTTPSELVCDDPISSTSSDTIEQRKSKIVEPSLQLSLTMNQTTDEFDTVASDPETDLLEMNISNVSNEKITEDVEDLVHDLESLLGESTDSFNITIKRKEEVTTPVEVMSPFEHKKIDPLVFDTDPDLLFTDVSADKSGVEIDQYCEDSKSNDMKISSEVQVENDIPRDIQNKNELSGTSTNTNVDEDSELKVTSNSSCQQEEEINNIYSSTNCEISEFIEENQSVFVDTKLEENQVKTENESESELKSLENSECILMVKEEGDVVLEKQEVGKEIQKQDITNSDTENKVEPIQTIEQCAIISTKMLEEKYIENEHNSEVLTICTNAVVEENPLNENIIEVIIDASKKQTVKENFLSEKSDKICEIVTETNATDGIVTKELLTDNKLITNLGEAQAEQKINVEVAPSRNVTHNEPETVVSSVENTIINVDKVGSCENVMENTKSSGETFLTENTSVDIFNVKENVDEIVSCENNKKQIISINKALEDKVHPCTESCESIQKQDNSVKDSIQDEFFSLKVEHSDVEQCEQVDGMVAENDDNKTKQVPSSTEYEATEIAMESNGEEEEITCENLQSKEHLLESATDSIKSELQTDILEPVVETIPFKSEEQISHTDPKEITKEIKSDCAEVSEPTEMHSLLKLMEGPEIAIDISADYKIFNETESSVETKNLITSNVCVEPETVDKTTELSETIPQSSPTEILDTPNTSQEYFEPFESTNQATAEVVELSKENLNMSDDLTNEIKNVEQSTVDESKHCETPELLDNICVSSAETLVTFTPTEQLKESPDSPVIKSEIISQHLNEGEELTDNVETTLTVTGVASETEQQMIVNISEKSEEFVTGSLMDTAKELESKTTVETIADEVVDDSKKNFNSEKETDLPLQAVAAQEIEDAAIKGIQSDVLIENPIEIAPQEQLMEDKPVVDINLDDLTGQSGNDQDEENIKKDNLDENRDGISNSSEIMNPKIITCDSESMHIYPGGDSDSEEMVPRLALEPDDDNASIKEENVDTEISKSMVHPADEPVSVEPLSEIEDILTNERCSNRHGIITVDVQENLETILAVASLQNIQSPKENDIVTTENIEPQLIDNERTDMEALRKAVESITETTEVEFEDVDNVVEELINNVNMADENKIIELERESQYICQDIGDHNEVLEEQVIDSSKILMDKTENIHQLQTELFIGDNIDEHNWSDEASISKVEQDESEVALHSFPDTSSTKFLESKEVNLGEEEEAKMPDSSQIVVENVEAKRLDSSKEKEIKMKAIERPKRHKRSDSKLEELSINIDVPEREKPYSPKVTIKPIKVPDEEVSTTSCSDLEGGKGSLKMTITKQSDKMHSILKICDPENSDDAQEEEEPIPKLIIKPKIQQFEQQHSPKMSTRSAKQVYSPTSSTQRSGSPRITIKPVLKPEKQESISPLKIKIGIKPEDGSKKHSPKHNVKQPVKSEEEISRESTQSPRKVTIKPVVKPIEEVEQVSSPRITIKPIFKPDSEKDCTSAAPKLNIRPIKKQEEEESEQEKERSSPKITIKPVVKPQEPDTQSIEGDEEIKERIVLKINKGNLPTPSKESKKREHSVDEDKSEKLAKITVKFSKGGGHAHIVQQSEESYKRSNEEQAAPEKPKKQKIEVESPISTRSKHKEKEMVVESPVETRSKHREISTETASDSVKLKQKETEIYSHESTRSKHKDITESPIESKKPKITEAPVCESTRSKQKDMTTEVQKPKQKDTNPSEKSEKHQNPGDIKNLDPKVDSSVASENPRSQENPGSGMVEEPKDPLADIPVFEITAESAKAMVTKQEAIVPPVVAPTPPVPRKRGRPRKVPIEVREEFKEQEEPKPKEPPLVHESGRPKRSCRGQSARATLGIKPRKPRGPGRGRGSKRGMGTRSVPMKPEKEPKLTKAKLKLMQASLKEGSIDYLNKRDIEGYASNIEGKSRFPILAPPIEVPPFTASSHVIPSISSTSHFISPKQSISETLSADLVAGIHMPVSSVVTGTNTADSSEIVMVDEETRMSADTNSRAQTPAKQVVVPSDIVIEESQSSVQSTATTESGKAPSSRPNKAPRLEVQEPEGAVISADQLTEYYWNGNGPFMLQEQVAQFLGIKSFKRKYPGIMRRMLEMQERDFIRESGLASEHMCDLGLTAVNSADILDIMYSDFQDKYEEYCKHQRDRQAKELINKQKALTLAASQEKNKADITEQAVQSAAQWNAMFNKTRREQRKACMDLQTLTVHYPKGKIKQINKAKVGNYPVALVPGQFTDYYKEFSATEINNLPINTMCYDPINIIPPEESDDSGSDGSESDSDSSSSSSGSGTDSSSGVEDCKLCKNNPKKVATNK